MTDTSIPAPLNKPRFRLLRGLTQNPVVLKELRGRMRAGRAFLIITIYLLLMSLLVGLIYIGLASSRNTGGSSSIVQVVGKTVFGAVVGIEMMMVCFLSPALTAGAIASERERQTFDLLRTTLLPARSLVFGKLVSALSFLVLLLVVGFPLLALASLFGGVSVGEVLVAFLLLAVTALAFCAIGLVISSLMRSTLAATVISYVGAVIMVFGEPTLLAIAASFISMVGGLGTSSSVAQQVLIETVLYVIGYLLVVVNPVATVVASELVLLNAQSFFYTTLPLTNGKTFPVISPWITYTILYGLFTLLLVWLSIIFVRRVGK